jgi:hypothetical protein
MPDAMPSEHEIDESLKETSPAGDPPSWTLVTRIGSPRRRVQRVRTRAAEACDTKM